VGERPQEIRKTKAQDAGGTKGSTRPEASRVFPEEDPLSRGNPWQSRFSHLTGRDAIKKRAAVAPTLPPSLDRLDIAVAQDLIDVALKELFVVTERVLDVLELHVNRAKAFSERVYPSEASYVARRFAATWTQELESATLMSGPAGSGKSQLARALLRVLPVNDEIYVGGALQAKVPLQATAYISFKSQATPRGALCSWLPADAQPQASAAVTRQPRISDSQVIEMVGYEFYRRGVVTAIGDEFQFVTQSSDANASLARVMLALIYLGVPVTNILNYSACYKLQRRPHEERDRLLANIVHLLPEAPESSDWQLLMSAYDKLLKPVLSFSMASEAEQIWNLTAASKRTFRRLITQSYRLAREAGRTRLKLGDLRQTYVNIGFSAIRADVEATLEMLSRGAPPRGRPDLWCPFGGNDWHRPKPDATKPHSIEPDIAARHLEESLAPEPRRELERLRATANGHDGNSTAKASKKQVKLLDAATLIQNGRAHRSTLKR
jgi:energy-coupling factor transporter ATP-binding protein EcfA2